MGAEVDKLREAALLMRSKTIANRYDNAGYLLAKAWIAEHPADDDLCVTREWLQMVGWKKEEGQPNKWNIARHDAMAIGLWIVDDGWKAMLIHNAVAQSCIVRGLKTRGDVRSLCKSLNIELKEK